MPQLPSKQTAAAEVQLTGRTPELNFGRRLINDLVRNKAIYIMLIPVIAYYAVFHYGPMYGAIIAFKQFNVALGINDSPWVGFQHFKDFFESFYFWRVLRNTVLISVYQLLFAFPAPIILALLLNEISKKWFKQIVQTISYMPHFISLVVVGGMITQFMARDGFITDIIVWFGGERTALLAHAENFRTIFITSGIWQQIGWGSIIYLAALSGINPEQYEAATVDGAGRLRKLWNITLPGLMPVIVILFIMQVGHMMDVGFEKIILLYNPNTYETADVINSFVYRKGLGGSFEYSFTTAVGLFQSIINFTLLISANYISRKLNETSLW
ncbi:ABC transporter permease [Paenibacillus sp. FSL K6-2859]|uniref:ABC transporter permease n=1 Tax=Paenibacillus sp. FSL K6-2859 TaxID=2921482 RepID=UPI004046CFAA